MANLRTDRKDHSDIGPPKDYFQLLGMIMAIIVVAVLIANAVFAFCSWTNNKTSIPEQNAKIEAFNDLPLESRKVIIEWEQIANFEPETYLRPLREKERISFWFIDDLGVTTTVAVLLVSAITFILYSSACLEKHYLCDIPQTWFGRMLFVIMFVGWPILLVSWVRMHIKEGDNLRIRRTYWKTEGSSGVNSSTTEQEAPVSTEGSAIPDSIDSVITVRPPITLQSDDEAKAQYLEFASAGAIAQMKSELKEVVNDILRTEKAISDAIALVESNQARLGKLKAKKENLIRLQAKYDAKVTREKAQMDWQIIRQMQGVYKVMFEPAGSDEEAEDGLAVWVRVCVPYDGKYYDFGDFRVVIDAVCGYECKEIRNGELSGIHDRQPYYRYDNDNFCFGDRCGEIDDYTEHGQYLEALALIIDCLHWVNTEDRPYIPECFREIDPQSDPVISQYYAQGGG